MPYLPGSAHAPRPPDRAAAPAPLTATRARTGQVSASGTAILRAAASASSGVSPDRAANQHPTGAAVRSDAWAAWPARASRTSISSGVGGSTPSSAANRASHTGAVVPTDPCYRRAIGRGLSEDYRAASCSRLSLPGGGRPPSRQSPDRDAPGSRSRRPCRTAGPWGARRSDGWRRHRHAGGRHPSQHQVTVAPPVGAGDPTEDVVGHHHRNLTTATVAGCPSCGVRATGHGRSVVEVRDLPAGGRP